MLESILMIFQAGVISEWTNDSQRFLLEHFDTIHNSPSHIYHSALPFCPSSSWLQEYYSTELSFRVKVVKGLPVEWGMCHCTVMLGGPTLTLSYHSNTVAVGSKSGDVIILNAVTGIQAAVLSGHRDEVQCLTFSLDGSSLVSGSHDKTVKLWDVQTGGVVKAFSGHTGWVWSVSISADYTTIASGSEDKTIHLWDIHTGKCQRIIKQQNSVIYTRFSPTDPKHLISTCNNKLLQWDTNGHQIKPPFDSTCTAFSPDGTQFVSCYGQTITVQKTGSGASVTQFYTTDKHLRCCCFSPDGRLIAIAGHITIYIWGITGACSETLIGHTNSITSLTFSSSTTLISASQDRSVRFWQIGSPSMSLTRTSPKFISLSVPIKSIALQTIDGIAITSHSDGMVKTWDISTGLCKASFQTPADEFQRGDVHLINGRLIFVCNTQWGDGRVYVWDVERGKSLSVIDVPGPLQALKISGDGSRVFSLGETFIHAWSVQTGEFVGKVQTTLSDLSGGSLIVDESKVWAYQPQFKYQGWDSEILGSSSVQWSGIPLPNGSMLWDPKHTRIKNAATRKVVFQLPDRFTKPVDTQCDGSYLVAGYESGDILILDLRHVVL